MALALAQSQVQVGATQSVEVAEVVKDALCDQSNTMIVKGDVILLVEGRSTWTDMIAAIKASSTVEIVLAADGDRNRSQKAKLLSVPAPDDAACNTVLTFAQHGQNERYKQLFREAVVSALVG